MKGKSMKNSTAIFLLVATALPAVPEIFVSNATAQVPVYQTTVTYAANRPVVIQNAPVVPVAPVVGAAPVVVVRQPVYVAPPPTPVYVPAPAPVIYAPPPIYYPAPVVSLGFGFGGCRPGFRWGVGFGFAPGYCW
jgi:hypothetical protein